MRSSSLVALAARRLVVPCAILGLCSCSGGSAPLYPASGKVLYKDQPAAGAVVVFRPKGVKSDASVVYPVGTAGEDGAFSLKTGKDDGAPAGNYSVTITWPEPVSSKVKSFSMELTQDVRDKLKGAYSDALKPQLEAEIKKGSNQLDPFLLK